MYKENLPLPHAKYGMYYIEEDLRDAAYLGDVDRMKKLFKAYPNLDPNSADEYGQTALYIACKKGKKSVVDFLLKNPKVDVNAATIRGNSPMLACAWGDYTDISEKLIAAGADLSLRTNSDRKYHGNVSALDIAEERDNSALVELLKANLGEVCNAQLKI